MLRHTPGQTADVYLRIAEALMRNGRSEAERRKGDLVSGMNRPGHWP
jgi:hypothetical protein